MLDLLPPLVALVLLVYFAYRGVSLIILAPLTGLLAVVLDGGLPPLSAYTQIFMRNAGGFVVAFFPLFLLGAIFGKLMEDSGSAQALAQAVSRRLGSERAILSVVLCCALLTYGGVSAFVVVFAIFPIAAAIFRQADIPKRLIPGAIGLGGFTFTMSALPGSPAIQNAIPMPFFNTTAFAAPGLGILTGIVMFGLGMAWLTRRAAAARAAGEGYGRHDDSLPAADPILREHTASSGRDSAEPVPARSPATALPHPALAVLPVFVVIISSFIFIKVIVPLMDTAHLADPLFGETSVESVRGVWAVIVGLFLAILVLLATNWTRIKNLRATLDEGADASLLPIFNTASLVGFGGLIAALPAFAILSDGVLAVSGGNPLVSVATAVAALSGITGSASGGMSIALEALGPKLVDLALAAGVSMEAMHRVASVASGALDALPHNGAVITILIVCKLTHKDAYLDFFVPAVVIQIVALIFLIVMASLFGTF
ncbi:MAG: GntP family permease [Rhodospirillales bacterium]|jgi:H+/gluconate symporter-like permease|nr:GntP family permease [Rhodospirillales bacterium]